MTDFKQFFGRMMMAREKDVPFRAMAKTDF